MVGSEVVTEGNLEDPVEFWRLKPMELRARIRVRQPVFLVAPKANLPKNITEKFLAGTGDAEVTVLGLVLMERLWEPEFTKAVEDVLSFVQSQAPTDATSTPSGQRVSLEVFLPPDPIWTQSPPSLEGVPVEWFQWVPVDEHTVDVRALFAGPWSMTGNTGDSIIARLLGHLAWWEAALRDGTGPETPYRRALLVYNAVTLLDWHATAPGKDPRDRIKDDKARAKAAKVIRGLCDAAQACVAKLENATGAKAEKQLAKLADALVPGVKKLAKIYVCEVHTTRVAEFEKPLKPAALIADWVATNGGEPSGESVVGSESRPWNGAGAFVLRSLLPAFAAETLFDDGTLQSDAYTAVRETCAEFLDDAIAIAVDRSKGKTKRRWREIGSTAAEAFRRPVEARSGRGES